MFDEAPNAYVVFGEGGEAGEEVYYWDKGIAIKMRCHLHVTLPLLLC